MPYWKEGWTPQECTHRSKNFTMMSVFTFGAVKSGQNFHQILILLFSTLYGIIKNITNLFELKYG